MELLLPNLPDERKSLPNCGSYQNCLEPVPQPSQIAPPPDPVCRVERNSPQDSNAPQHHSASAERLSQGAHLHLHLQTAQHKPIQAIHALQSCLALPSPIVLMAAPLRDNALLHIAQRLSETTARDSAPADQRLIGRKRYRCRKKPYKSCSFHSSQILALGIESQSVQKKAGRSSFRSASRLGWLLRFRK